MDEFDCVFNEVNKLCSDNNRNIILNNSKIENIQKDLINFENARLVDQEEWKRRDEQRKIFRINHSLFYTN